MLTDTNKVKSTTPGEWIVTTNRLDQSPDNRTHICVVVAQNPSKIIALTGYEGAEDEAESIANAALISVAPDMLEALVTIQQALMHPTESVIPISEINKMISDVFTKLANEAGEEL